MRKHILTLMLVMLSVVTFGQQWVAIKSGTPSTIQTELVASSESSITVNLQVPGFHAFEVTTPQGEANVISVPKTVSTAAAGEPDLPMIAVPVLIGDRQHYNIRVVNAQYADFQMEVAPSKGDFPRTINPEDVPYTYGSAYSTDTFFPAQNVGLYEPYILRDFRGQNMVVYPFVYNPISKTLRVYYNMTVEMFCDGMSNENILDRRSNVVKMDPEIKKMYENRFINYSESMSKYWPIVETGDLLIICHDAFITAMQPFVNWKKQIGRNTTMVGTSTAGTTDSAIKSYIESQYNSNNNLTHILLVGDEAQIPGHFQSGGGYSGKSDNWYGQVTGGDYYNDIIVGRFSAENTDHVTTQVNKVIHYERDINATDTWLPVGQGVSKNEGAGSGHFGEADYQHIDYIRDDLLAYNYTSIHRDYQGVTGVTSSAAIISQHINEGVSIINYCNHGFETGWGVFNYDNAYVNALTNDNKLPIVWSVAPLNGKYDYNSTCFAETWLRATNNSNGTPTGAIGGMFSYISQPWNPPMFGQDEMVDVLVESYSNNIKRTLGGCSYDGNMKILDQYGQSMGQGWATYFFWILFGDPSLTLRNAVPTDMGVTHASSMSSSATSFTVNATNGNGALATLTLNNEIMGSATINNGTANITFTAPGTTGTATLTVFGYNKITYIGSVTITQGGTTQYTVNVSANPHEGGTVTGGGTYNQGQSCTVTASPSVGYTFTNWTENGAVVSSQANYTFTVNSNRNLVANFQAMPQNYTITVSANPALGGNVTGGGTYQEGQSCTVTATANTGYVFVNWTENGNVVSNQANYTFTVNGNRTLVAQFQQQTYTISVSANPALGGSVTGGGTYTQGQSCTVTASANAGYTFTNWTENGNVVSSNASYTFNVTGNRTLVANFTVQTYTITVSADPTNGGTVTGGGTFNYGQNCTVTATANEGYVFHYWLENGNVVTTSASYAFTVTGNRNLVAIFTQQQYIVTVTANPTNGGTVSGGGTFYYGESCTVIATPNTGFNFINWTENGNPVSNQLSYTFTVTSDRDLVANFTNQNYIITAMAIPTDGGTVSGAGGYNYGQSCTLTATPADGYTFVNWIKDGTQVTTNPSYTFTVTESALYEAHFQLQSFIINASAEPSNGGSVTGGGTYYHGQTCTLTATPAPNYTFINWTKDGSPISEQQSYSFTVTENASYSAHFVQDVVNYTITVRAEPNNGGIVDGGGTFAYGDICTLKAEPVENYEFVNWTENGEQVTTDYVYSFPVTDNAEFVAHFRQNNVNSYVIDVSVEPSEGGAVSGGGTYLENTTCTLTASPNEGYTFEKWTIVGTPSSMSTNPYVFIVEEDAIYVAHFTQDANHFTVTTMADPIEGGTVSGSGTYELGAICTISAFPAEGYVFNKWTLNGELVTTNESFEFTVTGNAVYVAHFTQAVNQYAITASVVPNDAGSITGTGTYEEGDSCTLIAMPNPTYSFVSWTENGIVVSTDSQYSFVVDRERNLVAVFLQGLFYTISASAGANGTISPEGDVFVEPEEDKTFAIIPNNGCQVRTVLVDGIDLGPIPSYTFRSVNGNHSIHAEFSGLGVDDNVSLDLKIYPNPANDKIHIESPNMKKVSIFNLMGVQIENKEVNDNYTFVNTNGFPQGTYILKVENNDGRIGYLRFVIAK